MKSEYTERSILKCQMIATIWANLIVFDGVVEDNGGSYDPDENKKIAEGMAEQILKKHLVKKED